LAEAQEPEVVEVNRAQALAGIPHGFLGRRGGVSTGPVAGLNVGLGSGDEAAAVAQNRARAANAVLPDAALVACYQVHSADCVTVTEPWSDAERPHADALVTNRTGLLLSIVTADCTPVLLADREAGVIGAAHAGWKGAIGGVIENTIGAMLALGARREAIAAAIGPTIAQPSYEVDDGFHTRFLDSASANARFFVAGRRGHWQFDLPGYVAARLASARIGHVEDLRLDTYTAPDRFYSFRRATHHREPAYGRQMALIGQAGRL
jgi:YfiH family protein